MCSYLKDENEKLVEIKTDVGVKQDPDMKEEFDVDPKWPALAPLPPALTPSELTSLFSAAPQEAALLEKAFVLELNGGVLVRNQDGLFENFTISTEEYVSRLVVSNIQFYLRGRSRVRIATRVELSNPGRIKLAH